MPRGWGLESANSPWSHRTLAGPSVTAAPASQGNRSPPLLLPISEDAVCLEQHGLTPPVLPTAPLVLEPQTGHVYVRTTACSV